MEIRLLCGKRSGIMIFRRTEDLSLIRRIVTHPKIWPMVTDDFSPAPEYWQPIQSPAVVYALAEEQGRILGLFMFIAESPVCSGVHICMLPEVWGRSAKIAAAAWGWIFETTNCRRITGAIPIFNAAAIHGAIRSGMRPFGVNPRSYMKHGKLHHQLLLGVSRPTEIVRSLQPCPS